MSALPACSPKRIALFGAHIDWLVNLRGPVIRALAEAGHDVVGICPPLRDDDAQRLAAIGARFRPLDLKRAGLNPLGDIAPVLGLRKILAEERPWGFLCYGAKPIIFGLPVAKSLGVKRRVALITGLGYAFTEGKEFKRRVAHHVARNAYRASLTAAHHIIFQNDDDRRDFLSMGIIRSTENTEVVAGSGIDLDAFLPAPMPDGPPTFLLIARLLYDKGVALYAEAARQVKAQIPEARFMLVGPLDPNPAGIPESVLKGWVNEGLIDYRGELRDVRPALEEAHVFVLPTYYREGTPRTVLEALAKGRPVITTDAPGCRHTVRDSSYGSLVPPKDEKALVEAMLHWAKHPDRASAGASARQAAERWFDARVVASRMAQALTAQNPGVSEPLGAQEMGT